MEDYFEADYDPRYSTKEVGMRFKEGDIVLHVEDDDQGEVLATFLKRDGEWAVVQFEGYGEPDIVPCEQLSRPPKKFSIEGDMCPGAAGDVPVILAGPQGMIKNFSDRMEDYFEAEYDPTRGDNYHVTITVELVRGG